MTFKTRLRGLWAIAPHVMRPLLFLGACCLVGAIGVGGRAWLAAEMRPHQDGALPSASESSGNPTQGAAKLTVRFAWDTVDAPTTTAYVVSWGDKPGVYTASTTVGAKESEAQISLTVRPEPYYVVVQARDASGTLSGYSNPFSLDVSSGKATAVKEQPRVRAKPKREKAAKQKALKKKVPKEPKNKKKKKARPPSGP